MTDLFEEQMREALQQEAESIRPGDRLGAIRVAAHRRRRWVVPLLAAAAVLVLAVGVGLAVRPAAPPPDVPSKMLSPNGPMVETVVPVYYVAPLAPGSTRYALVEEQRLVWLPWDATPTDRANTALAAAAQPPSPNPNGAVAAWTAGGVARIVAHPGVEVDLAVSAPGEAGLPDRVQELAVQALVWTATEALGEPNAPVMIYVAPGGNLFETMPSNVYKRPGDERLFEELAPISIEAPYSGQRIAPTTGVVVQGDACTVEGNIVWELSRDGAVVARGNTTASSGCPQRGTWSVDLGPLATGSYQFGAFAVDAQTGGLAARTVVPFSVG